MAVRYPLQCREQLHVIAAVCLGMDGQLLRSYLHACSKPLVNLGSLRTAFCTLPSG